MHFFAWLCHGFSSFWIWVVKRFRKVEDALSEMQLNITCLLWCVFRLVSPILSGPWGLVVGIRLQYYRQYWFDLQILDHQHKGSCSLQMLPHLQQMWVKAGDALCKSVWAYGRWFSSARAVHLESWSILLKLLRCLGRSFWDVRQLCLSWVTEGLHELRDDSVNGDDWNSRLEELFFDHA